MAAPPSVPAGATHTTPEAARDYLRRGWAPVPIRPGDKRPPKHLSGWQNLRVGEMDIPGLWSNGEGIGLLLGDPSGGLVDVDLDCPEAIRAAELLLPETSQVHGRRGAPGSRCAWR